MPSRRSMIDGILRSRGLGKVSVRRNPSLAPVRQQQASELESIRAGLLAMYEATSTARPLPRKSRAKTTPKLPYAGKDSR